MSQRTTLHHVRKAAAALVIAAAAFGLTACQDGAGVKSAPSTSAAASGQQSPEATVQQPQGSGKSAPSGTPKKTGEKCTDRIDYAGDPRSNAEINSIGADTGRCPAPKKAAPDSKDRATPSGTPKEAGKSCTNQIDYAGDPRSNAVINSIGEKTGYCPPVQK
ncbi:hypothetical protein CP973_03990 [Streptomyces albofaciens JCM 4342]|uniref:hypothetical protein n=1 Tax=Streptomyces albofaciens TaxID=66866 RepID=UPI00123A3097|nr:hypothetical protein [Streptomyces albofaciens]KAA6221247.1 hypothetical protein CP973_03990 [Streptomyces albofaciens JCM 4342]